MTPLDALLLIAMWGWALAAPPARSWRTLGLLVIASLAWMAVALLPPGLGLAGRSVVAFVVLYALLLHGDAFERVPATQRRFGLDYLALLGDVSGLAQRQRTGEISIPELIVGLDRLISALEGLEPPDGGWEQLRAATVRHLRAQIRRYQAIAAGQPLAEEEFSAADSEVDRLHAQYSTLMRN